MTDRDWEQVDLTSRDLVKALFKRLGASDIRDTHGECSYDIWLQLRGKKLGIEVKDRTFAHTKYGDVFAEEIKLDCNLARKSKREFDKILCINVYTDGVLAIANMEDKRAKKFKKWC